MAGAGLAFLGLIAIAGSVGSTWHAGGSFEASDGVMQANEIIPNEGAPKTLELHINDVCSWNDVLQGTEWELQGYTSHGEAWYKTFHNSDHIDGYVFYTPRCGGRWIITWKENIQSWDPSRDRDFDGNEAAGKSCVSNVYLAMNSPARAPPRSARWNVKCGGNRWSGGDSFIPMTVTLSPKTSVAGRWAFQSCLDGRKSITVKTGVTSGQSTQTSSSAKSAVSDEISADTKSSLDFTVADNGGSTELGLSETHTSSLETELTDSFTRDFQATHEQTVEEDIESHGDDGQYPCLWLWSWSITPSGSEPIQLQQAQHRAWTANRGQPPRCLPGWAKDFPTYQTCVDEDHTIEH